MNRALPQQAFAAAVLDPARAAPPGLRVASGVNPERRFAVHRNTVAVGLIDALAAAFPVTQAVVGEPFFRAMARERVATDPPRSRLLTEYGDGFAAFIADFGPAAGLPFLADVAQLEYLRTRAFHAADAEPVAAAVFAALAADPARLAATRVHLHPACHWLRAAHAAWSIWNAHQDLDDPADADLADVDVARSEAVLVTRPYLQVNAVRLPAGGADLLDALRAGRTLGEAMAAACTDATATLEPLFALIVEHGLAIALATPEH